MSGDEHEEDRTPDRDSDTAFPIDRRSIFKWAGAVAGAGALSRLAPWRDLLVGRAAARGSSSLAPLGEGRGPPTIREAFDREPDDGWGPAWITDGVASRRIADGDGVLEAGTNIYPSDKRAVAFLLDARARDTTVAARIRQGGVGPGLVLRRTGPRTHYAAILEREEGMLKIVARSWDGEEVLARAPLPANLPERVDLSLTAEGASPTELTAGVGGPPIDEVVTISATDDTPALQSPGDPGVLATAETGFRAGPPWRTSAGTQSARAAWVVDQATQLQASPVPITEARQAATELTSTAVFEEISLWTDDPLATTPPSTVAATTLDPVPGGARSGVVADVPCEVAIEVSLHGSFDPPDAVVDAGPTNRFHAAFAELTDVVQDQRVHWRPRLTRGARTRRGPVRSFRALPADGHGAQVTIAVGACATQFTTSFPAIEEADPDVFVWEGDINYIDASGPLAQTETGYAGLWKDVLNTPELEGILHDACFVPQRDDHDYGLNDCWRETIPEHGKIGWDLVMHPEPFYRFGGGLFDAWVLDQRRWRDDPSKDDTLDKTLVGEDQLAWLLDGMAASDAPFKLICSPDPFFNVPNDSNSWAKGYNAERGVVLDHIEDQVSGTTVFVTGDTHSGAVTRRDGFLEVRAAPMDIPGPGQHDASSGDDVVYSEQGKFFCLIEIGEESGTPTMDIALKHADGATAWSDTLEG